MNFIQVKKLWTAFFVMLFCSDFSLSFAHNSRVILPTVAAQGHHINLDSDEEEDDVQEDVDTIATLDSIKPKAKNVIETAAKVAKESFASRRTRFLNSNLASDTSLYFRTTLDGALTFKTGENEKNPVVDGKISLRGRYTVGTPAEVTAAAGEISFADTTLTTPATDLQRTVFWLRELFLKVSLDNNPEKSEYYVKFGSFPYDLGRGIALGSAYSAGGFLGLTPSFSINQYAPGFLFHGAIVPGALSGDIYYALLANPNGSFDDNTKVIRANELKELGESSARGLGRHVWVSSGALHWKAIKTDSATFDVNPYAYLYSSPDQKLEFTADSDSNLWAVGTAGELKAGKFEFGFDGAFQGGVTKIKAWDRNYTAVTRASDASVAVQYSKVYEGSDMTTLALVTDANKTTVKGSTLSLDQNGQQIGESGLYNSTDRFRPEQRQLYHGYFFVTDASYELVEKQLKICGDVGGVSGQLSNYDDVAGMTTEQQMNQKYNGFVPLQSIYSGKRLQHLVMLNLGIPRFTVDEPQKDLTDLHVTSKVTGSTNITNKFMNLAYTGLGFEYTPAKLADQKVLIKPVAFYYWMMDAPLLADGTQSSHALGTTLSLEVEATLKECLDCSGYVGWMLPGKQYEQFKGTELKGGTLGNDNAYVVSLSLGYKF
jgi:hypothetical protein